jgi:hypothetical protein
MPAARSKGEPRSSIAVPETTSTFEAAGRDARRNGHPTAPATHPDLADLEKRIRACHRKYESLARRSEERARRSIQAAKQAGDLLIQAKSRLKRGDWESWVEEQCGFSARTARDYMSVAKNWAIIDPLIDSKRRPAAVSGVKEILHLLAKPRAGSESGASARSGTGTSTNQTGTDEQADVDVSRGTDDASAENTADAAATEGTGAGAVAGDGTDRAEARREAAHEDADRRRDESSADGRHGERADHRTRDERDGRAARAAEAATAEGSLEPAGEDRLTDKQWLASLNNIRRNLADPTHYDKDALIWRRLRPGIDGLIRLVEGLGRDAREAMAEAMAVRRYPYRVALLIGVAHPRAWDLCRFCNGKGRDGRRKQPCVMCDGAGYRVTEEEVLPPEGQT